jgi:hypothetical protein
MSDKKHWILKIVPALAFAAGIIMASIGGIMVLSSGAKLALFDHGPYNQVTRQECKYNYDYRPVPLIIEKQETGIINDNLKERSEEEITKCVNERKAEEKNRFQQDKKQNLVDGFSALIIGLILVFAFRKREE